MRRIPDLEREILLAIERDSGVPGRWVKLDVPGYTTEEISYHVCLLDEAGLIIGKNTSSTTSFKWEAVRLTMAGHQYLEVIRDVEIWDKTKEGAAKVGSFSLDVLSELAKGFVKKKIEQHTGVQIDI